MKSSHRDLSNDVTELWSILKNNQNTFYPRFGFTLKTGIELPETGITMASNETVVENAPPRMC